MTDVVTATKVGATKMTIEGQGGKDAISVDINAEAAASTGSIWTSPLQAVMIPSRRDMGRYHSIRIPELYGYEKLQHRYRCRQ